MSFKRNVNKIDWDGDEGIKRAPSLSGWLDTDYVILLMSKTDHLRILLSHRGLHVQASVVLSNWVVMFLLQPNVVRFPRMHLGIVVYTSSRLHKKQFDFSWIKLENRAYLFETRNQAA